MMKLKRLMLVLMLAACAAAPSSWARGNLSRTLTVLVVPSRFSTVQLGMDVIQRHYVVLVAYQGEAQTRNPALHVYDGQAWRTISLDEVRNSSYLARTPGRIVLVGDDVTLPRVLAEAAVEAAPVLLPISSLDTASIVNDMGSMLGFRRSEWAWFAHRYGLELTDDNAQLRARSYYDTPHDLKGGAAPPPKAAEAVVPQAMPREDDIPAAVVVDDDEARTRAAFDESAEASEAIPVK